MTETSRGQERRSEPSCPSIPWILKKKTKKNTLFIITSHINLPCAGKLKNTEEMTEDDDGYLKRSNRGVRERGIESKKER